MDVSFSKVIDRASDIRNSSDYDDFFISSEEETLELVEQAKAFVDAVKRCIWQENRTIPTRGGITKNIRRGFSLRMF